PFAFHRRGGAAPSHEGKDGQPRAHARQVGRHGGYSPPATRALQKVSSTSRTWGWLAAMVSTVARSSSSSSHRSAAVTVAVRGRPNRIAISPKKSPSPSSRATL